jgi:ABC-type branched-subunit amino acid transport system ATPase component
MRFRQLAGTMSGGEQAMLSIGIGSAETMIDEPPLELSPLVRKAYFGKQSAGGG